MDKNIYQEHPVFKGNLYSKLWTTTFLTDQLFGFSQRSKNDQGQVINKYNNPALSGKVFQKLQHKLAEKLKNSDHASVYKDALPVEAIDKENFTSESFRNWKHNINAPLVVRGYLNDAPIRELTREDNLIDNFGHVEVHCANSKIDKKSSNAGQNIQLLKTTLKEYLSSDDYENYYLNNFQGLINQRDFYRLCKGIDLERTQDNACALNQWFIKRGLHSRSSLHCANFENIFLNVQGRKEWHFIHPSYTPVLQTTLSKFGVFAVSEAIKPSEKEEFYPLMKERFDFFKHIPVYKVILEPGDILYNPPWWWHDVRNVTSFTMGCASRWVENGIPSKRIVLNSKTLFAGQMVELIKAPKKSPFFSIRKNKDTSQFIESIFSNKWSEVKEEEPETV